VKRGEGKAECGGDGKGQAGQAGEFHGAGRVGSMAQHAGCRLPVE
jgi:hypothetical protein